MAIFVQHLQHATLARFHRSNLRAQVAHGTLRNAHIDFNDLENFRVGYALAVNLDDRHLQAFGEDIEGHAIQRAADVLPMRHASRKTNDFTFEEHGHHKGHVVEVTAGDVSIVGQQHVAILNLVVTKMGNHAFDRVAHASDEHGQTNANRHRVACTIKDAHGEIQGFVNDHVVGGSHEVGLHLLGRSHHAIANDLCGHRINFVRFSHGYSPQ